MSKCENELCDRCKARDIKCLSCLDFDKFTKDRPEQLPNPTNGGLQERIGNGLRMERCDYCAHGEEHYTEDPCKYCNGKDKFVRKMIVIPTNADRIRAMTDEQLAELIDKTSCGLCSLLGIRDLCRASKDKNCFEIVMAWLKQPAKEV